VSTLDLAELRSVALRVAVEAAELVAEMRDKAVTDVNTKSTETDVVTAGDRAAERLIRDRLATLRPGEPVYGEEEGGTAGGAVTWVVDPIDGTVNYLYGLPWYAVSVAAVVDWEPVAAAVVEPVGGRQWTAARGQGALLGSTPLRVTRTSRLDLALVGTGFAYSVQRRGWQARLAAELIARTRDVRRCGASVLDLCSVAAGWLDGYVEHGLHPWDWAGGALIAAEAGAVLRVPEADGSDPDGLGADFTLAAAPGIAGALADLVREVVKAQPPNST
jgi:myo-inositol-1(or 4)-monophosphatase